jgi:hypothetical protein
MPLDDIGRTLLVVGVLLTVMGVLLPLATQVPWIGRLPGDVNIERGNLRFYAPLATCVLLSLIVTLVVNLLAQR